VFGKNFQDPIFKAHATAHREPAVEALVENLRAAKNVDVSFPVHVLLAPALGPTTPVQETAILLGVWPNTVTRGIKRRLEAEEEGTWEVRRKNRSDLTTDREVKLIEGFWQTPGITRRAAMVKNLVIFTYYFCRLVENFWLSGEKRGEEGQEGEYRIPATQSHKSKRKNNNYFFLFILLILLLILFFLKKLKNPHSFLALSLDRCLLLAPQK
jgi:hypothetical protein